MTFFKYVNITCPYYIRGVLEYASKGKTSSRNIYARLKVPFQKLS